MNTYPVPAHDSIMGLSPYVGGASSLQGISKVIKLSSNEGAFGTNPTVVEACKKAAEKMFRYPDGGSVQLRQTIAEVHGLEESRIVCGCGSDELIGLLCHAYLNDGDEVIVTQYAFLMYRLYALGCGAVPVTVMEKDRRIDVDAVLNAVTDKTKIVFITNPGNPTGTYLNVREIDRLCRGLPPNVMVVLDSAYAEYVPASDFNAGETFVGKYPNVVMLRTFSKIYGLGGIRLGWSYASQEITDVLNRVRGPFNVNSIAQAVGVAAMKDRDFVKKSFEHNLKWQTVFQRELPRLGLTVTPSVTNFILADFPSEGEKTAKRADEFLRSKGIIVRAVNSYGFPDSLRMTIGNDEESEALLSALKEFMAG